MPDAEDASRYQTNLRDQLNGAALYTMLASAERGPLRKDLFVQLADAETRPAEVWRQKLRAAGITAEAFAPTFRTRLLGRLARRFGPGFVMPSLAAAEFSDRNKYAGQADAQQISAEEHGYAAVVQAMAGSSAVQPPATGFDIARAESWHRGASGNDLRAAVLGANDGLVSNFCLLMGVAGAGTGSKAILLTGAAGLIAGACSMALGEWLSVANARELAAAQIEKERQEIEQTPQAEQNELALIFQAKGLARDHAQHVAADIRRNKSNALDTLVREELGIDPAELGGSPWRAGITSSVLFAVGAAFPTAPYLWSRGSAAIGFSVGLSALALGTIGIMSSLFNGRSAWYSAVRQIVFGCAAAGVTYGAGAIPGVSLS